MTKNQQKPKLTGEQRDALLTWLAAEYSYPLICKWFEARGWEPLSDSTISYHRTRHQEEIEALRKARRESALNTGLAVREERVQQLKDHADELEVIKWEPDEKGRLWNEKAWRETLADIAAEMGDRKQNTTNTTVNVNLPSLSDEELEDLARKRGII